MSSLQLFNLILGQEESPQKGTQLPKIQEIIKIFVEVFVPFCDKTMRNFYIEMRLNIKSTSLPIRKRAFRFAGVSRKCRRRRLSF